MATGVMGGVTAVSDAVCGMEGKGRRDRVAKRESLFRQATRETRDMLSREKEQMRAGYERQRERRECVKIQTRTP